LKEGKPFIGYHAAVALLNAVRAASHEDSESLNGTVNMALQFTEDLPESTDRRAVLKEALNALNRLSAWTNEARRKHNQGSQHDPKTIL
jgi:hypothetical protein